MLRRRQPIEPRDVARTGEVQIVGQRGARGFERDGIGADALGRFAVPAAAPVLLNLVFIAALLVSAGAGGDRAVILAWGVLLCSCHGAVPC